MRTAAPLFALIQGGDGGHLVLGELKAEDVEILRDPRWRGGLREEDDAILQVPADDDLRRADIVRRSGVGDLGGLQNIALPLPQRPPCLDSDGVGAESIQLAPALQVRVEFDLIDRRLDVGLELQLLQVFQLEVGDADGLCLALLLQLNELLPRLDVGSLRRGRPVDKVKIHIL